jgi:hypothetical protein
MPILPCSRCQTLFTVKRVLPDRRSFCPICGRAVPVDSRPLSSGEVVRWFKQCGKSFGGHWFQRATARNGDTAPASRY